MEFKTMNVRLSPNNKETRTTTTVWSKVDQCP
jgi:hypothetical protein